MQRFMILAIFLFTSGIALSQNTNVSLNEKWEKMLDKAESFENYKVIKKTELSDLWKSVQDTVSILRTELKQERSKLTIQQDQITTLQKHTAEVNGNLESVKGERDSMNFLGMQVDKYSYAFTLWALVFIILAGCCVLFFMYRNSNVTTTQKISEYEQLSKSFEEYKQGRIEMERKLKREVQTYMNQIEELKKR
jgi:hypothetical protein